MPPKMNFFYLWKEARHLFSSNQPASNVCKHFKTAIVTFSFIVGQIFIPVIVSCQHNKLSITFRCLL